MPKGRNSSENSRQEKILTVLRARLAEQQIILDEQYQILDEQGRVLAKIVAINGKLIIQRQETDIRIAQNLDEVERILRELISS
jgi:hypothetical protein